MNDLYQEILDIVCRVTGIGYDEIFSSNKEQCVDVRSLLINTLIDKGLTEREIVYLTKMSQQRGILSSKRIVPCGVLIFFVPHQSLNY